MNVSALQKVPTWGWVGIGLGVVATGVTIYYLTSQKKRKNSLAVSTPGGALRSAVPPPTTTTAYTPSRTMASRSANPPPTTTSAGRVIPDHFRLGTSGEDSIESSLSKGASKSAASASGGRRAHRTKSAPLSLLEMYNNTGYVSDDETSSPRRPRGHRGGVK